jgi:hypothetical protein
MGKAASLPTGTACGIACKTRSIAVFPGAANDAPNTLWKYWSRRLGSRTLVGSMNADQEYALDYDKGMRV